MNERLCADLDTLAKQGALSQKDVGRLCTLLESMPSAAMIEAGQAALHEGAPLYNGHTVIRVWRAMQAAAAASPRGVMAVDGAQPGDLDPRTALAYAKRMKDYCESFNGRDWPTVMLHGSPDEQNLAHALDNLMECAAMLMNMADRVAAGVKEGHRG